MSFDSHAGQEDETGCMGSSRYGFTSTPAPVHCIPADQRLPTAVRDDPGGEWQAAQLEGTGPRWQLAASEALPSEAGLEAGTLVCRASVRSAEEVIGP